jgi:hypothetical protein
VPPVRMFQNQQNLLHGAPPLSPHACLIAGPRQKFGGQQFEPPTSVRGTEPP